MWLAIDTNGNLECDTTGLGIGEKRKLKELVKKIDKRGGIMARIKVKVLNEECRPERTHRWDAGWDLKAAEEVTIPAGKVVKVSTGVIAEIPPRHFGMVVPRSSYGVKHRLTLANDIGVIDTEYRGEIFVFLSNDGDEDFTINQYDRFCQLLIVPVNNAELWVVDALSKTDRGDGGFGSTTVTAVKPDFAKHILGDVSSGVEPVINTGGERYDHADDALYLMSETGTNTEQTFGEDEVLEEDVVLTTEEEREKRLDELKALPVSEYMTLKNTGKLFEMYPIATGDMKIDLDK